MSIGTQASAAARSSTTWRRSSRADDRTAAARSQATSREVGGARPRRRASSRLAPTMIDGVVQRRTGQVFLGVRHAMSGAGPSREEMETAGTRRFQRFQAGRYEASRCASRPRYTALNIRRVAHPGPAGRWRRRPETLAPPDRPMPTTGSRSPCPFRGGRGHPARVVESALPPAGGPPARPPRGGQRRRGGEIWTSARLVPRPRQPIGDFAVEALNELSVVSLDLCRPSSSATSPPWRSQTASFEVVVSTLSMHHWADATVGLAEIGRCVADGVADARLGLPSRVSTV
jgi:hypothetical protein